MKTIFTLLFSVITIAVFGQFTDQEITDLINNADEKKLVIENSRLMKEGFFYQAEMIADKLLTLQPESPNYNYRKGFLVLEIRRDFMQAIPYLSKAIQDTKPHFDETNPEEQSAPADAFYHLAVCYQLKGDLDKAIENYNLFISKTFQRSETVEKAELRIKQCQNAKTLMNSPVNAQLINLGKSVNSSYPDYSPVISLDGTALYFTSRRPWDNKSTEGYRNPTINQYPEDVYVSYMDFDSTWTEAVRLDFCIPKRNEATIAVSSDERRILLYEDSTGSGDIYYSDFYSQKFNEIKFLDIKDLNSPYWETHCVITPDKNKIYFSSDRPGGFGGRDLYVMNRINDTSWSKPMNLGAAINTKNDEDAPFVSIDNSKLYFASNGDKSMGGFDIFVAELNTDGTWTEGKNLGYPFNSTNDDIYYTTTIDGLRGYLTSFRGDGAGEKDIYEVHNDFLGVKALAVLKGIIRTRDGSPLPDDLAISMQLQCKDCDANEPIRTLYPRLRDGVFISDLKPCKTYALTYFNANEKTIMYEDEFKTECNIEFQEIHKEMVLDTDKKIMYPLRHYALDGSVVDDKTNQPIRNALVQVKDLQTGKIIETTQTGIDGTFKLHLLDSLQTGDLVNIELTISKDTYLTQSFLFKEDLQERENINLNYRLNQTEVGMDIANAFGIKNIYFDFDKATIRPDAKVELDKIVKIMNDNPSLEIEFGSHTDCRGSASYNKQLSERRAKASAAYIKARISNPNRIHGKGYGETQLTNDCACEGEEKSDCTVQEHQANRRTEFRILKK